ncbi:MAG: thiamine pyrophosphate-binding protein [Rhodospirillaceae bacterium]|nr:thiamine pyrophosphate-binding protein [Rhodospirillaceae bacterium]
MTSGDPRFVDWLARELAGLGARHAFGVPGGGNSLDLLKALQGAGIRSLITAREDAAVIMAGVSGRLTGAPGVAFTTKGPGLASAANGLASAALDRMPTLLVSEGFDREELTFLSHQVFDQSAFVNGLLGDTATMTLDPNPATVGPAMREMMQWPMSPRVLLADPAKMTAPVIPMSTEDASGREDHLDEEALDRARALLKSADRPVVVVGLEATTPECADAITALIELLGAPALCTYMAKGVVADDHPLYAGIFTGGAIEQPCVGAADLIVLIGLDPVELIRKPWPYEASVLDICASAHEPHYMTPDVRVVGRLAPTVFALAAGVSASNWKSSEVAAHRAHFMSGMTMKSTDGLTAADVVRIAQDVFEAKPRLTVDAGAHMFSACAFWPCSEPLDLLISNGLATMGFALPAALAAALHDPERGAVAMTGDGGLMMCLGELKTAAVAGANLTVIVFNDGRLSLIDIKREQLQMAELGLSWEPPDFATIAQGFSMQAWIAQDLAELRSACEAAAQHQGPCLIDARIDPSVYLEQMRSLRG